MSWLSDAVDTVEDVGSSAWSEAKSVASSAEEEVAHDVDVVEDEASEVVHDAEDDVSAVTTGAENVFTHYADEAEDAGKTAYKDACDFSTDVTAGVNELEGDVTSGLHSAEDWVDTESHELASEVKDVPVVGTLAGAAADTVTMETQLAGGIVGGATTMVGGLVNAVYHPIDTLTGLEALGEHLPGPAGEALTAAHNALNVVEGKESIGDALDNTFNPLKTAENDAKFFGAMGKAMLDPYEQSAKEGRYGEVAGRAAFDIGSMLLGAGEAEAAADAGRAGSIAADAARGTEAAADAGRVVGETSKATEATDLAADEARAERGAKAAEAPEAKAELPEPGGDGAERSEEAEAEAESMAKAHENLKDRFQIVDERKPGDAPNVVTQEEYDKTVKQYSDLSRGKGDLKLDTAGLSEAEAADFKSGAMEDVGRILQTNDGRKMLEQLQNNQRAYTSPLSGKTWDFNRGRYLQEGEEAVRRQTTIGKSATPWGAQADWGEDAAGAMNPMKGADVAVKYQPGAILGSARSDTTLFHEMRHAVDETRGSIDPRLVDHWSAGADAARNPDVLRARQMEYQTVGLGDYAGDAMTENSYRAARKQIGAARGPGVVPGDVDMPQRTYYERV
jgi:hypothetical protein